jgi:hypothetical protein
MNKKRIRSSISSLRKTSRPLVKTGLLLLLFFSACSPGSNPAAQAPMQDPPTAVPSTPSEIIPTATTELSQTPMPEADVSYPYYLALTVKPDVAPQTINGVTVAIDWAYADESRVAIHYTISGLDWAEGASMEPTQMIRMTSEMVPDLWMGGMSGNRSPAEQGVITGEYDQRLMYGALDQQKNPNIRVNVDIPVEGPTSVGTFRFVLDLPVLPGKKIENINQTVIANNVSMTLKDLRMTPSYVEASICFQMPSAIDWGLGASIVNMGGKDYPFSGGGVMPGTKGKNFNLTDPERCNTVGFDIAADPSASSLTLTVPKLMASIPEVVTQERVDLANQMLADEGIEFKYVVLDHGSTIEIVKRPEGKTDQDVYPLILDALTDQYDGPWVFTVPLP